jgi:hypothetical protein
VIEIKCPYNFDNHVQNLLIKDEAELLKERKAYWWQLQMNMLVAGKEEGMFISYDPRMDGKNKMAIIPVHLQSNTKEVIDTVLEKAVAYKKQLIETIALLNASSKNWTMADYVLSWSSINPDYVKLNRYFQIYDVEISIIASILSNGNVSSAGTITKKIKQGEFAIQNEEENVTILDGITDILKVIPRMNRFENRYVCAEYVNFRRTEGCSYDHKAFMKKLEANKKQFILATQEQEKLSDMFRKLSK